MHKKFKPSLDVKTCPIAVLRAGGLRCQRSRGIGSAKLTSALKGVSTMYIWFKVYGLLGLCLGSCIRWQHINTVCATSPSEFSNDLIPMSCAVRKISRAKQESARWRPHAVYDVYVVYKVYVYMVYKASCIRWQHINEVHVKDNANDVFWENVHEFNLNRISLRIKPRRSDFVATFLDLPFFANLETQRTDKCIRTPKPLSLWSLIVLCAHVV